MYYKITVENLSNRILNITQQEVQRRGRLLRVIDAIGSVKILLLTCEHANELAGVVTTLETDRNSRVMFVQDERGKQVDFGSIREAKEPSFNRDTLSMSM